MSIRIAPPGRASNSHTGLVKPFGPHHEASIRGSVQTWNTSARGASSVRTSTSSCATARAEAELFFLLLGGIGLLLFLQLAQVVFESVETLFPEAAVLIEPVVHVLEARGLQAAGAPLRVAAAGDEPGALEHLEMLGD